jgi:broad specificity phosphatase PhoE
MDIYLVRHGEAAASWGQSSDPGLSELGKRQADVSAQSLHGRVPNNVQLISSPLLRARETADPLAAILGQPVLLDDVFREIPAPVPLPQRQVWLRQFMQEQWAEQPEGLKAWRAAASQRLLDLSQPAVVFTHFLVINAIVGLVLERAETLCFMPDNASITHLRLAGGGLELVALGDEMQTVVN